MCWSVLCGKLTKRLRSMAKGKRINKKFQTEIEPTTSVSSAECSNHRDTSTSGELGCLARLSYIKCPISTVGFTT